MASTAAASGGVGFFGLLTIVFIALKLMGYITWSWLWVLAPLWMPFLIGFVVALFVYVLAEMVSRK